MTRFASSLAIGIVFKFFDKTFTLSTYVYGLHRFKDTKDANYKSVLQNYQVIRKALNANQW